MEFVEITLCKNESIPGYVTPGDYIDTLNSIQGCDSIVNIHVKGLSLYFPNVFSPNGDGYNDIWTVVPDEIDFQIHYFGVFDRFGDLVHEAENWPISWDGSNKQGKYFQPGVFAFVFLYECGGQNLTEYGTITLVK
jgi:gliding motility-associated-like protein